MADSSLVGAVLDLGQRLGKVLKTLPKENPFEAASEQKTAASFLFEMHVLLGLLEGLRGRGWAISEAEPKAEPMRFLRAPGQKKGTTFFRAVKAPDDVQVVHGSGVLDRFGATQHPDISIQRGGTTLEPTVDDLVAMWDMKVTGDFDVPSNTRISRDEVASFHYMASELGLPKPGQGDEALEDFPIAFTVSGLIGNGQQPTTSSDSLLEKGFSCVAPYQDAKSFPRPLRDEHLATGAAAKSGVG